MTYFVTGTDTDVGKTIACAWLMLHMHANYWKPIQSGLEQRDIDKVKEITALPDTRFFPSTFELTQPLSPHESAKRDNIEISLNDFTLPKNVDPLLLPPLLLKGRVAFKSPLIKSILFQILLNILIFQRLWFAEVAWVPLTIAC